MKRQRDHAEFGALIALFAGALSTGGAGILVRLSETGPTATAFWRGCLALPLLAAWALLEPAKGGGAPIEQRSPGGNVARLLASFRDPGFLWAGVFFAGDLALWNWSLLLTSIAASTLEASLAPIVVIFFAWLRWGERPSAAFMGATALAFVGMLLIVSPKFGQGGSAFLGDVLGLGTACFFAAYILAVARLRARYGTGVVMFNSTVVFTVLLLPLALTQKFFPDTLVGLGDVGGKRGGRAGPGAGAHCVRARAPAAHIQLIGIAGTNTRRGCVGMAGVGRAPGGGFRSSARWLLSVG